MSILCLKSLLINFSSFQKETWNLLPEKAQMKVVEYLTPKEKAKLSMTSKTNYTIVKKVPTYINCLQFSPIRYNAKSVEIFVFFDELNQKSYSFYFDKQGINNRLITTKNGGESVSSRDIKRDFREMADECFEGWLTGTKIHTLDVRGDYNGKLPSSLEITNFSFSDKYNRSSTAIPNWLDVIMEGEVNFLLMSDHWDKILCHKHFSNPISTCKLTGYDGIGHEHLSGINCRQIQLNNVKDEQCFNFLTKKWSTGNLPDSFEWLIVTSVTRPLKTEKLLANLKVQSLDSKIFEDSDKSIQEDNTVEYFLIFGENERYAVFCGIDNYARLSAVNSTLVVEIPELKKYYLLRKNSIENATDTLDDN